MTIDPAADAVMVMSSACTPVRVDAIEVRSARSCVWSHEDRSPAMVIPKDTVCRTTCPSGRGRDGGSGGGVVGFGGGGDGGGTVGGGEGLVGMCGGSGGTGGCVGGAGGGVLIQQMQVS